MLDRSDNAKKFESPANVVLARGIQIKIKDIPKNTTLKGKVTSQERSTNFEDSIMGDKQIVVPSFGTAGALFARHFDILRNLKRRILLLKQAYLNQQDDEKAWEQVAQIIKTLDKGCLFLNFDELSSKPTSKQGTGGNEEESKQPQKKFYEDATLAEDEHAMNNMLEEKRRVEELLKPQSLDLGSPTPQNLSKNPSSSKHPPQTANSEIKEADEEGAEDK